MKAVFEKMQLRASLAGLRLLPVAGCRPHSGRQVPTGAGAAEPEKRASPAPVVSVREERRREKNGSGEQ